MDLSDGVRMLQPNYVMQAQVTRVIDGDTLVVNVSPAFKLQFVDYKIRLHGVDTPELNSTDPLVRQKAVDAKMFVRMTVEGKEVLLQTVKRKSGGDTIDSFGRYLAIIYYIGFDGQQKNLNEELLALGFAVPYVG